MMEVLDDQWSSFDGPMDLMVQAFPSLRRSSGRAPGVVRDEKSSDFSHRLNLIERERDYLITVSCPDIPRQKLKLEVVGNTLLKLSSDYGEPFSRSMRLPEEVDPRKPITAKLKDGILTITVQKSTDSTRVIPIKG